MIKMSAQGVERDCAHNGRSIGEEPSLLQTKLVIKSIRGFPYGQETGFMGA